MTENVQVPLTGVNAQMDYEFTQNWFQYGPALWPGLKPFIPNEYPRKFMEIGSFEGKSAVWTMENMMEPGDTLICVDTWKGGEEHSGLDMDLVFRRFQSNIERAAENTKGLSVIVENSESRHSLASQMLNDEELDFIYIDGSHQAHDVLRDCVMGFEALKKGGVMVMDDYLWGDPKMPLHRPKMAIDAFMNLYAGRLNILHIGYQVAIQKS